MQPPRVPVLMVGASLGVAGMVQAFIVAMQQVEQAPASSVWQGLFTFLGILFGTSGVGFFVVKFITARLDRRDTEQAEARKAERDAEARKDEQYRKDQDARYAELRDFIDRMRSDGDGREQRMRAHYEQQVTMERENTQRAFQMLTEDRARNDAFVKELWRTNPETAAKVRRAVILQAEPEEHPDTT